MKIVVKVITNAKTEKVLKNGNIYRVYVAATPERGRANKRVQELLAEELGVKLRQIHLISGVTNKIKQYEVR